MRISISAVTSDTQYVASGRIFLPPTAGKRKGNRPKPEPRGTKIRAARVEPVHPLVCFVGGSRAKLTVKDISVAGLSVWSTMPLSKGFVHEFRLIYGQVTVVR